MRCYAVPFPLPAALSDIRRLGARMTRCRRCARGDSPGLDSCFPLARLAGAGRLPCAGHARRARLRRHHAAALLRLQGRRSWGGGPCLRHTPPACSRALPHPLPLPGCVLPCQCCMLCVLCSINGATVVTFASRQQAGKPVDGTAPEGSRPAISSPPACLSIRSLRPLPGMCPCIVLLSPAPVFPAGRCLWPWWG